MQPHKPAPPNRRRGPRTQRLSKALQERIIPLLLESTKERVQINSPSIRFDEGASAEAKLALIMPSEEEKVGEAHNGWPKAGVVT